MITLKDAFVYLVHQEADRIHWYKTKNTDLFANIHFGPKSADWASYTRSKKMASLYLTAIGLIKHFGFEHKAFKEKVFKSTAYEALRANKKLQAHSHKHGARNLVRKALRQIKRIDLNAMEKDVIPWIKQREIDRLNRLQEEDRCASTR